MTTFREFALKTTRIFQRAGLQWDNQRTAQPPAPQWNVCIPLRKTEYRKGAQSIIGIKK